MAPAGNGAIRPAPWRTAAASVRGPSHQRMGVPCQDSHACDVLADGALVAIVADGAGSAAHSELGSAVAVQGAMACLRLAATSHSPGAPDAEELVRSAVEAARRAVEDEARHRSIDLRDLATTIIVLRSTPSETAAAQVGDGAAVIADSSGAFAALTRPHIGEYQSSTVFVTSPDWQRSIQSALFPGCVQGVAVFTDGLDLLALTMPGANPHAPFFAPLFEFARITEDADTGSSVLAAFLTSPRVTARTDDDLTLMVGVRCPAGPQG